MGAKKVSLGTLVEKAVRPVTVEEFILVARGYKGTPYRTQGRSRRGVDCGGLLLVVCWDTGYTSLEVRGYATRPNGEDFEGFLESEGKEIDKSKTRAGDVVAFDYGQGIQHIALVTEVVDSRPRILHAKPNVGVIEQVMHGHELRSWVKSYRLKHL